MMGERKTGLLNLERLEMYELSRKLESKKFALHFFEFSFSKGGKKMQTHFKGAKFSSLLMWTLIQKIMLFFWKCVISCAYVNSSFLAQPAFNTIFSRRRCMRLHVGSFGCF